MNLRKNVRNLSDDELKDLRNAYERMMQIGDNRGYNHLAGLHGAPNFYCWHHQLPRLFLPWHRAYLYWFEQAAQDQAESVMIPWWDWSSDVSRSEGIPEAFADETINRRHSNPLYKAHINVPTTNPPLDLDTFRMPGRPSALPNYEDVNRVLSLSDFGDFNDELEDLHDRVHGWTGGTMGRVATGSFLIQYSGHTTASSTVYGGCGNSGMGTLAYHKTCSIWYYNRLILQFEVY